MSTALVESAALRRCVGEVEPFVRRHWRRTTLYRPGADRHAFADLFTMADADELIATRALRPPAIRLVADRAIVDPATYARSPGPDATALTPDQIDPGRVYALFDSGATIVLQGLHEYWPPLTRFCRQLELALTQPVGMNAYLTPPGAQGFPPHGDPHDVIVLQLSGRKHWRVYEPGDDGEPERIRDLELAAGDALYLPEQRRHEARTADTFSAHLTISVHSVTWRAVFSDALLEILGSFDDPLPLGFAADPAMLKEHAAGQLDRLKKLVAGLDPAALVAERARSFWTDRPPVLTGQLGHLLRAGDVDDESVLRRRADIVCKLSRHHDRVELLLGDRELTMPAWVEPALARMLTGAPFTPAELTDHLDRSGRLVLVRRLIREGLLEPVSRSNAV